MTTGVPTVLVNLTWLVPGVVGGSEESVTDALRAVRAEGPDDLALHLAVLAPFAAAHPDLASAYGCSVLPLDGRNKALRVLAEQTWLARTTRRVDAAVVHHAGGVVPLVHPRRVVLTIQDLQPLDQPHNFAPAKRAYIRAMAGRSARAAQVVTVPSEFSRGRVVELLGVDPARVVVVPWFPRPAPSPSDPASGEPGELLPPAVAGGRPYFLYPAITYPHKNHLVLLEAFARVAASDPDVALVLTGGEAATEAEVRERIARPDLRGRVARTGRVPAATLEVLYRHATAVVVPSRYEGFGLPVLEAQLRGCPVVSSSAGSLPEVARPEDLVDPDDVTAWAEAMHCVLRLSAPERAERVAAGRRLAAAFTPGRTAAGLLGAYRQALGHR
ncbi:MAG TPA: glycosyltransferase family 1 protein [Microthrixaceae bacterium]|nr:glycosyltransferase family 1 protein [Microthrixaceae bacterium]